jgi:hypothetical protein
MLELQALFRAGTRAVHLHRSSQPPECGRVTPALLDATGWPVLWARCWGRIRTWRVPPRWSGADWCDEVRAQRAFAACVARRGFDPRRSVRLDAFLYRRVVEAVRARYLPEWSFGSRVRLDDGLGVASVLAFSLPDLDLLEHRNLPFVFL